MAILIDGKAVSQKVKDEVRAEIERDGLKVGLAVVIVGNDQASRVYVNNKKKACEVCGIRSFEYALPEETTEKELLDLVDTLNKDPEVNGILVQLPLPKHLDEPEACSRLRAEKDVDGVTDGSLAGVFTGSGEGFPPCTAQAVLEILDHYGVTLRGKRAVVAGRSLVVGRPAAMLLMQQGATVTICHSATEDMPSVTRQADILVCAVGKKGFFGAEHIAPGQTLIAVGIHYDEETGRLCGDVRFDEAEPLAAAITPVPGGVGAVTTAVLVSHVTEAAMRMNA